MKKPNNGDPSDWDEVFGKVASVVEYVCWWSLRVW